MPMVYIIGVIGFIGGFAFGQMVLWFLLRHRPRADLLKDESLKWTYGILNWLIAGMGSYAFVFMYRAYFG